MAKGKRKLNSIEGTFSESRGKKPRYNLRSRGKVIPSDTESDSSVIFVGSSVVSPRTATTITKRNLKKKLTQAKRNARRSSHFSYQHRRHLKLVDAYSQTHESFKCSTCTHQENVDPEGKHGEKTLETIYTNKKYKDNDETHSVASAASRCASNEEFCENQNRTEEEPSKETEDGGNCCTTANLWDIPTGSGIVDHFKEQLLPQDDAMEHQEVNGEEGNMELVPEIQPQSPQTLDFGQELPQTSFGTTINSESYLTPIANTSMDEDFSPPPFFQSEIEFGCRLDDVEVNPIEQDEMCRGDGTHNDQFQVHVIDLGDNTFQEYLQGEGSSNESDGGPHF